MIYVTRMSIVAVVLFCLGCGPEYYAEKMVKVDTSSGKWDQMMAGSGEGLIARGKISDSRTFLIGEHQISLWLINATDQITSQTAGESLGTVLLIHDLGKSKASMLSLGKQLAELGYDVVMPDLRCHGASSGEYFTYGAKEKGDLKVIMDQLLRERAVSEKIIAYGEGLGGSIAIQYAQIDPHCAGVAAFQPYSDIHSVLRRMMTFSTMSQEDLDKVIQLGSEMAEFAPIDAYTADAVKKLECPLLVIRRLSDLKYPDVHGQTLYETAGGPKLMVDIKAGGDDMSYAWDPEGYIANEINSFVTGGLVSGYYRSLKDQSAAPAEAGDDESQALVNIDTQPRQFPTVIHRN